MHSDHLGTATYVTDSNGDTAQFFLNLPFGETMVEQTGAYDNPYKFNAKELDEETGLYYYGSRYYNSRLSIWYGVDPAFAKFPSWNPYSYTLENPVNLIDPNGKWVRGAGLWNNLTKSDARIRAEQYANTMKDYNPSVYRNADLWSVKGERTSYDGSVRLGKKASFNSKGMVYSKSWSLETGNIEGMSADYGGDSGLPSMGEIPASNSVEAAMGTASGQLAVAGLYGLQGAVSGIATEYALGKLGLSAGLSWSATGSKAGDALGSLGVQTGFSSGGVSMGEAFNMIPDNFLYMGGLKKGEGFKFADPATGNRDQILLEHGNPASRDPLHSGPYIRIGPRTDAERIPLQGNSVLNIGR